METKLIVVESESGGFTVCEVDELGNRVAVSGPWTTAEQAFGKLRNLRRERDSA